VDVVCSYIKLAVNIIANISL